MPSQDSVKPRCKKCGVIIPRIHAKWGICVRCLAKYQDRKEQVESYAFGRKQKTKEDTSII